MVLGLLRRLNAAKRRSIAVLAALVFATTCAVDFAMADDDGPPSRAAAPDAGTTPPSTEIRTQRDEQIATAVSHALADDRRVNAMNVKVAVRHGVVTLTGRANDADEQRAAEDLARRVPGVRDVENRLVVAEPGAPAPGTSMIPEVPSPPGR
jgi:hypothetical protein